MKLIGLLFGIALAAQPFSVSVSHAQDITRVLPSGLTITRVPGQSITVERQGKHRSFSYSIGRGDSPTATASATATGTNFAYASAKTSATVRTNANGQSIDTAKARAVAVGNVSSTTSAVTKP